MIAGFMTRQIASKLREPEPPESPLHKIVSERNTPRTNTPLVKSPTQTEDDCDDCVVTFKPLNAEERSKLQIMEEKYAKLQKDYVWNKKCPFY